MQVVCNRARPMGLGACNASPEALKKHSQKPCRRMYMVKGPRFFNRFAERGGAGDGAPPLPSPPFHGSALQMPLKPSA